MVDSSNNLKTPHCGGYEIGSRLGQPGTFGEVRKCENINTKNIRAVKILNKSKMNALERERFSHEIDILKRLDHPNIIKIREMY